MSEEDGDGRAARVVGGAAPSDARRSWRPGLRVPESRLVRRLRCARSTSASTASSVWLKDESAFGDGGWGGNKVRKLAVDPPGEARERGASHRSSPSAASAPTGASALRARTVGDAGVCARCSGSSTSRSTTTSARQLAAARGLRRGRCTGTPRRHRLKLAAPLAAGAATGPGTCPPAAPHPIGALGVRRRRRWRSPARSRPGCCREPATAGRAGRLAAAPFARPRPRPARWPASRPACSASSSTTLAARSTRSPWPGSPAAPVGCWPSSGLDVPSVRRRRRSTCRADWLGAGYGDPAPAVGRRGRSAPRRPGVGAPSPVYTRQGDSPRVDATSPHGASSPARCSGSAPTVRADSAGPADPVQRRPHPPG